MIDLACGVIRISNNVLALRYSINKVIRILLPCSDFHISTWIPKADAYVPARFVLQLVHAYIVEPTREMSPHNIMTLIDIVLYASLLIITDKHPNARDIQKYTKSS